MGCWTHGGRWGWGPVRSTLWDHLFPAGWGWGWGRGFCTQLLLSDFWVRNRANRTDRHVAKALDMAMILDYWGREPGEMVTRVKVMKVRRSIFHPVSFPCLRKQGHSVRVGVEGYRAAGQAWNYFGTL